MPEQMQKTITILEVEERTSKKSGNKFRVAQCVVKGDKTRVGELMIFKPDLVVEPGEFRAHFEITVNFEKQVSAELVALVPLRGIAPPSAKAA